MSEADIDPYHMPDEYTKVEKGTKSKSFARRAIGYLPTVASGVLGVANAANAAGFVHNPQLRSALETANAIKKYVPLAKGAYRAVVGSKSVPDIHAPMARSVMTGQRHSLRKQSMGY